MEVLSAGGGRLLKALFGVIKSRLVIAVYTGNKGKVNGYGDGWGVIFIFENVKLYMVDVIQS